MTSRDPERCCEAIGYVRLLGYLSDSMWNQLPPSFHQHHSVHCPPGSPDLAHITSSQSPPSLSSCPYHSLSLLHKFLILSSTASFWLHLYCLRGYYGHCICMCLFVLFSSFVLVFVCYRLSSSMPYRQLLVHVILY